MYVALNSLQHQTYDSEQLNIYIVKKKNTHKSKHVLISIEKNFSSSVQDELQPITRAVLSGKVRMQDSITAIA